MTNSNKQQQKAKVAYILKMFPRFSETFILNEILELEREGADLQIFSLKTPNDGRVHADVAKVKAPIHYVELTGWKDIPRILRSHARVMTWNPRKYFSVLNRTIRRRRWGATKRFIQAGLIASQLRDAGITHVHAHFASSATSVAYYLHKLVDMEYSFTAHAKDIFINTVAPDVLLRKMRDARFVVTISEYNANFLSAISPTTDLHRIYNGLDLNQFMPNGTQPTEKPLVLAVGRLVEKKGFDDLICAAALLKNQGLDFEVQIIGTGDQKSKLRNLIDELGVGDVVSMPGPMPREELIKLYPTASVFAAPCIIGDDGNRDGLPTVLIEAMAMGVPVVSTPVTGIPELVRHEETGYIVPESSPEELAESIRKLIDDRESARLMAGAGRQLVEDQFNLRTNVRELRELFEEVSVAS